MTRRRLLGLATAAAAIPLFGPLLSVRAYTAAHKHDAEEVRHSGRLVSVKSTTDDNGTFLRVSGNAVVKGFRILGGDGPLSRVCSIS